MSLLRCGPVSPIDSADRRQASEGRSTGPMIDPTTGRRSYLLLRRRSDVAPNRMIQSRGRHPKLAGCAVQQASTLSRRSRPSKCAGDKPHDPGVRLDVRYPEQHQEIGPRNSAESIHARVRVLVVFSWPHEVGGVPDPRCHKVLRGLHDSQRLRGPSREFLLVTNRIGEGVPFVRSENDLLDPPHLPPPLDSSTDPVGFLAIGGPNREDRIE